MILGVFPSESPFRVDQVMAAPWLLGGLFLVQLLLAAAVSWSARARNRISWSMLINVLLMSIAVFFTLACWGTSDITKLNFYFDPSRASGPSLQELLPSEPAWWLLAPWISHLPYRMAAVHGLLVAAYASVVVCLARSWRQPAWAGWWALLLVSSPMLRGFFQNAHSRQALASLLAVPLLLWSLRVIRWKPGLILGAAGLALGMHVSAAPTLLLALMPACPNIISGLRQHKRLVFVVGLLAAGLVLLLGPALIAKLQGYAGFGFFSTYLIKPQVLRNECLIVGSIVLVWLRQRFSWQEFWGQREGLALMTYLLVFIGLQGSLIWEWFPQLTFRVGDTVGCFLLLSFIAWLHRRNALTFLLPLLALNLLVWMDRVLWPEGLDCGRDDDFLCVPDRWPWLIHYPTR